MNDLRAAAQRVEDRRRFGSVLGEQEYDLLLSVHIEGSGEGTKDINFPVWFTAKPALTSPVFELDPGQTLESGNYPVVSLTVVEWVTTTVDVGTFWTGASLAFVALGKDDQAGWLQFRAAATGLRNPPQVQEL